MYFIELVVTVVSSACSCLRLKEFDLRLDRVGICLYQAILHGSGLGGGEGKEGGDRDSEEQETNSSYVLSETGSVWEGLMDPAFCVG